MENCNIYLSSTGLKEFSNWKYDNRGENLFWTTDPKIELPIFMWKSGEGS